MNQFLRNSFDVQPGERKRVAIMAAYAFLIIAAYNIIKPMTRSLFVSKQGLDELPLLYMILAVAVGIFVVIYMRVSVRLRLDRLLNFTNAGLIVTLLAFYWLLKLNIESASLYYILFIWASVFGVLTTSQFWLLANYMFNAREAKRLFSLLASSSILGGITGGYITRFLVGFIGGTENLAFVCVAILVATVFLINVAWRYRHPAVESGPKSDGVSRFNSFRVVGEMLTLLKSSRHLTLLVGIVSMTYMVVQITDFQFIAYASNEIQNVDDLTGFLGFWISNLSIAALVFQLFAARFIIERFGVGVTILFLPIALLLGSVWVIIGYGLSSILALKVGDGAFRHSINKVGTELLYLPMSVELKKKTKAFVDMFVDRFARGVAGLLLLVTYTWLGLSVPQISWLSIAIIAVWLVLASATYREYVNSFRNALVRRSIDVDTVTVSSKDSAMINLLVSQLSNPNERQVVYALKLLESVSQRDLGSKLVPLLQHESAEVRKLTLRVLRNGNKREFLTEVQPLLRDKNEEVQLEAIRLYLDSAQGTESEMLRGWLNDKSPGLRGAALSCITEHPDLAERMLTSELLDTFLNGGGEERRQLATALGKLPTHNLTTYFDKLLRDENPQVRLSAISSVASVRSRRHISMLIEQLDDRKFRKAARIALAAYGEEIIDYLDKCIRDETLSVEKRGGVIRVLGLIASKSASEVLLQLLGKGDDVLQYQVIKALSKIRTLNSGLEFDERVDQAFINELKKYVMLLTALYRTNGDGAADDFSLLTKALEDRLDEQLERIFRLLGLRYPPKDIYNAFAASTSSNRTNRANAVEFLDNILSSAHKRMLLPIVEDLPPQDVLRRIDNFLHVPISSRKEALAILLDSDDHWLQACAAYEIGRNGLLGDFRERIKGFCGHDDLVLSETAEVVLRKFPQSPVSTTA